MQKLPQQSTAALQLSVRDGKNVGKLRIAGPAAILAREFLALDFARADAARTARQAAIGTTKALQYDLARVRRLIGVIIDAAFFAAGWYRPSRHRWQPWRAARQLLLRARGRGIRPIEVPPDGCPDDMPESVAELIAGVHQARALAADVVPRLRDLLETDDAIWRYVAARVQKVETTVVEHLGDAELPLKIDTLRAQYDVSDRGRLPACGLDYVVLLWLNCQLVRHYHKNYPPTKRDARTIRAATRRFIAAREKFRKLQYVMPVIQLSKPEPRLADFSPDPSESLITSPLA